MKNIKKQKTEQMQQMDAEHYRAVAEAHKEELKGFWKEFLKTGVFVLAVLVIGILGGIAWFVANNRVSGDGSSISAEQEIVRIASKGVRQTAEEKALNLPDGKMKEYGGEQYYYTEGGEIAMRLSEDYSVSPGSSGSIEFYIIPTRDGAMTVNLYLGLAGYVEDDSKQAVRVNDDTLEALLGGHILLFKNCEDGYYSGWLYNESTGGILNNTITIQLPADSKAEQPYPYTVYWIWPKRYENMVNDLFEGGSSEFKDHFLPFVEKQATESQSIAGTSYKYSRIFLANKWPLSSTDVRAKAYNLADEYIGTNADYLYLTISTSASEEQNEDIGGSGQ